MRTTTAHCIFAGLGLVLATQVQAATVTGTISATLTLTAACQVNSTSGTSGLNFGTLDFGSKEALFTSVGAQVIGGGGGGMSILCSAGTVPIIKVAAGAHDGQSSGGTRALANGSGSFVPYDFYTDSGYTTPLAINGTITLPTSTGVAQTVNLYGKALGKAGLPAGVYTDTVAVELSF